MQKYLSERAFFRQNNSAKTRPPPFLSRCYFLPQSSRSTVERQIVEPHQKASFVSVMKAHDAVMDIWDGVTHTTMTNSRTLYSVKAMMLSLRQTRIMKLKSWPLAGLLYHKATLLHSTQRLTAPTLCPLCLCLALTGSFRSFRSKKKTDPFKPEIHTLDLKCRENRTESDCTRPSEGLEMHRRLIIMICQTTLDGSKGVHCDHSEYKCRCNNIQQ